MASFNGSGFGSTIDLQHSDIIILNKFFSKYKFLSIENIKYNIHFSSNNIIGNITKGEDDYYYLSFFLEDIGCEYFLKIDQMNGLLKLLKIIFKGIW